MYRFYSCVIDDLTVFFVTVYTGSETWVHLVGCPRNSLNVNRWVNEIRNIDKQCKTPLLSYFTQVLLVITEILLKKCRGKINKIPIDRNNNDDHQILNLHSHRESKICIHSFKLSWDNIKHGPFTL